MITWASRHRDGTATHLSALTSKADVRKPKPSKAGQSKEDELPVSSSVRPNFAAAQESLFRDVLFLLNECRVPYAVSGAFALQIHTGIWRSTKDIDLFLTAEDVPAALRCLEHDGFQCEVKDPVWLHKARRKSFFVDLITGMSNAVITVERSWIENAVPANILSVPVRVLAAEELLVSKLFVVRRERYDGADIAHIIYASHGNLDWDRIFSLVGVHWEMLLFALVLFRYVYPAQSHYVPAWAWQRLLKGLSDELENRNPDATFRGSLVDENMFAIDVAEWGLNNELGVRRELRRRENENGPPCASSTVGGRK
jgi:hypothetical protein